MKKINKIGYMIIAAGAVAVGVASFLNKRIEIIDETDDEEAMDDDIEIVVE